MANSISLNTFNLCIDKGKTNQELFSQKRTSLSKNKYMSKASVTVELALTLPFFCLVIVSLLYLIEITTVQMKVRDALYATAFEIAEDIPMMPMVSKTKVNEIIQKNIAKGTLNLSLIEGQIDTSKSYVIRTTGNIFLKVSYKVKLPVVSFHNLGIKYEEHIKAKGWVGYTGTGLQTLNQYVFITDNASVYHTNPSCTHLKLSISQVSTSSLSALRNTYGGKYYRCPRCNPNGSTNGNVYITKTGSYYHSDRGCSALTRSIYCVSLDEVVGKGVCSRCGGS